MVEVIFVSEKSEKKEMEIITGDGENLDISPVYEHLEVEKPKQQKKENIVIPEEKDIKKVKKE